MAVILFVVGTAAIMIAVGTRFVDLHFLIGPWFAHHWVAWAGVAFVAVFTPFFYVLKRKKESYSSIVSVHVVGGLVAAMLVSVHFIQHVTRPAEFFPDLGTGIVLYAAVVIAAFTGVLMKYRWLSGGMREWRTLHVGAAGAFYLTVVVHALEGLGII